MPHGNDRVSIVTLIVGGVIVSWIFATVTLSVDSVLPDFNLFHLPPTTMTADEIAAAEQTVVGRMMARPQMIIAVLSGIGSVWLLIWAVAQATYRGKG